MDKQNDETRQVVMATLMETAGKSIALEQENSRLKDALIELEKWAQVHTSEAWVCDVCQTPKPRHSRTCPFSVLRPRSLVG